MGRPRGASDAVFPTGTAAERIKKEEDMRPWIENMKSWMRIKAGEGEALLARSVSEDLGQDVDHTYRMDHADRTDR
jgi:hypothetical protein